MVVGIIKEADRTLRERMEAHLAGDLRNAGCNALSAYATYGPNGLEGMSEADVLAKFHDEGLDAVVTIALLDKQKEQTYVPGGIVRTSRHNRFYGYYRNTYDRIAVPGYYVQTTRCFWESNLYDLHAQKLAFSV